jgi:cytochrome c peroxidase
MEGIYNGNIMALTTTNISRADLWFLAGIVASEYGAAGGRNVNVNAIALPGYTWNRTDCLTSPEAPLETDDEFPKGIFNVDQTLNWFATRFNFSDQDTVAILGSHSLGKSNLNHSGFIGRWVPNNERLSNNYYRQLALTNWRQVSLNLKTNLRLI